MFAFLYLTMRLVYARIYNIFSFIQWRIYFCVIGLTFSIVLINVYGIAISNGLYQILKPMCPFFPSPFASFFIFIFVISLHGTVRVSEFWVA